MQITSKSKGIARISTSIQNSDIFEPPQEELSEDMKCDPDKQKTWASLEQGEAEQYDAVQCAYDRRDGSSNGDCDAQVADRRCRELNPLVVD